MPAIAPSSIARANSPASLAIDSRESVKSSPAAIVAVSSSRIERMLAPTAFTWAPGASHACSSTGVRELVAVTTTSASSSASRALDAASKAVAAPTCSAAASCASARACSALGE